MADAARAAHAARLLSIIIAGLALAFTGIDLVLGASTFRTDALRLAAIVLVALLTARGVSWARVLLLVLTGVAAAMAVLTAITRSLPLWGRMWFLVYGAGTLMGLALLFMPPAAAHFSRLTPKG